MAGRSISVLSTLLMMLLITGCAAMSPTYINDGNVAENSSTVSAINPVHFKLADSFKTTPPNCIAVLPLHNGLNATPPESKHTANDQITKIDLELNAKALEQLRWNLYAHLAPYPYRDIEIDKVNDVVSSHGNDSSSYAAIASELNCDGLLLSEVVDYSANHYGIYSQVSIGIRMQLIRAKNNEMLWQGHHIAKSQGGSVPLTPVDIVVGIYSATENISDEQLVRVEDDLFRRLLSTWDAPDLQIELDDSDIQLAENIFQTREFFKENGYPYSISVENLYLRSGPGTKFTAETVLNQQDKLAILDHEHSPWLQVKVAGGQLGYVNKKYIKAVGTQQVNEQLAVLK